jgi:hypothetical protein
VSYLLEILLPSPSFEASGPGSASPASIPFRASRFLRSSGSPELVAPAGAGKGLTETLDSHPVKRGTKPFRRAGAILVCCVLVAHIGEPSEPLRVARLSLGSDLPRKASIARRSG